MQNMRNMRNITSYIQDLTKENKILGQPRVAQQFSTTFNPGRDLGDPGSSPTLGSQHGACFSLCLCLCLSFSVSLMNK